MRFVLLLLCLLAAGTFAAAPAFAQDAAEIAFWESVRDSQNPAELQAYLDAYPTGAYAALAKIRIGTLGGTPAPAPAPAPAPQPTTDTAAVKKSGPQIAPDKATYAPLEQITISWEQIPASLTSGWIALYKQGETVELIRASLDLTKSGSTVFEGMLPGTYEARLLTPPYGSEYVMAKTSFTIAEPGTAEAGEGAALTLVNPEMLPFEPIEVIWDRIPTSMHTGWVRMSKADGTEMTRLSIDTSANKSGSGTFEGTLPGEYVFDLLSPPYGSELLLASVRLTIIDPNAQEVAQPEPAPTPAPEPAPTPEPAPAPEPEADATRGTTAGTRTAEAGATVDEAAGTGVERSTLGQIVFADRPKPGDPNLGPMLLDAIKDTVPVNCTGPTESYSWTIAAEENARVQQVLNDAAVGLKQNGYDVAQIQSDLSNALFYKATRAADSLLMMWLYEEDIGLLGMVLCPTQ